MRERCKDSSRRVVHVLQQARRSRAHRLQHSLRLSLNALQDTGWTGDDVGAVHAAQRGEVFLDAFKPCELVAALRWSGLRRLSRRVSRSFAALCDQRVVCGQRIMGALCAANVPWWRRL